MSDNALAAVVNDARGWANDLHRDKCMVGPEGFTSHHPDCQTLRALVTGVAALRAKRDEEIAALRVRVAVLEQQRDALQKASDANMALAERLDRTLAATLDERDALKAQVEAARGACMKRLGGTYSGLTQTTARLILNAMDEAAKP